MKIKSLNIIGLHDHYNYENITFNSDVTIIYGLNGSGKTTVLNIIENIITGQLYKLFDTKFNRITLKFQNNSDIYDQKITLSKRSDELVIIFNNEEYTIKEKNFQKENRINERPSRDKNSAYFYDYPILKKIRETFNYVYLPLNRLNVNELDNDEEYYYQNKFYSRKMLDANVNNSSDANDPMMAKVDSLIYTSFNKINSQINKINNEFRNKILKSLLDLDVKINAKDDIEFFSELILESIDVKNLKSTNQSYIKLLKDLSLLDAQEEIRINLFFKNLIVRLSDFESKNEKSSFKFVDIFNFIEVRKAKLLVELAKKTENEKSNVRKPIDKFVNTINSFFINDADGKKVVIDESGHVYFLTSYSDKPISIHYLSSGEKQIVNFYANLIFKVGNKESGIFVVDEPEISLHLIWQKNFIDKTLEINKNLQFIFATHSPEIIGKHRDKLFNLKKEYRE